MPVADLISLFDIDNTLLDNDAFGNDLDDRLDQGFGIPGRERYRTIYEQLRQNLGYADYLGALEQFRAGNEEHPDLLRLQEFLLEYPFTQRLYPGALTAIATLGKWGATAILSDGDIVFQPRKAQRSGIWDAVEGRVMICAHKERALDALQRRFPAKHYLMVDDKPSILTAMKAVLGTRLSTVFVRQGHYAAQADATSMNPPPDHTITHIGELADAATAERLIKR